MLALPPRYPRVNLWPRSWPDSPPLLPLVYELFPKCISASCLPGFLNLFIHLASLVPLVNLTPERENFMVRFYFFTYSLSR